MALTAAELTSLKTVRANHVAKLLEISANPLPSYSVGVRSFTWVEYYRWLEESIRSIDALIVENESGAAWEVRSRLRS